MPSTVILSSARTPIGKLGGGLSSLDATELGSLAIAAALQRAEVAPEQVEQVVMGQVLQAGQGQIPSRQAQIKAGIPKEVPSETINKVCASGLRASALIDQGGGTQAGRAHLVDRLRGDLLGDTGFDLRLARRYLSLPRLQHLSHHHLLDLLRRDLGALQRGRDRERA